MSDDLRPRPLLPVAFTGARGAYSQQAARRYFGAARAGLTCRSASAAVRALVLGQASHAVLPVENTITGGFAGLVEALFEGEVGIEGEVLLPIRHCLLGTPGARLQEITVVTSHPSALAQCRDWLAGWGVATRASSDTGEAARELSLGCERALGVLGSRELAEDYGLEVLAEGVSDRPRNRSRFFVLVPARGAGAGAGIRTALLLGPVTAPRTLKTLRIQLESRGASRVRVPLLGAEDGQRFLLEFDLPAHRAGEAGAELARGVLGRLPYRCLGSWVPAESGSDRMRVA